MWLEWLGFICGFVCVALLGVLLWKIRQNAKPQTMDPEMKKQLDYLTRSAAQQNQLLMDQSARQSEMLVTQLASLGDSLRDMQRQQQRWMEQEMQAMHRQQDEGQQKQLATVTAQLEKLERDFSGIQTALFSSLDRIRNANAETLERLRRENQESLDKINVTVGEKLQQTLDDRIARSFAAVNERLTEVYQGLGEMKAVAAGVSDLKKVLSNVKTRGTLGEIQLVAILSEILTPEQYGEQVAVKPGSAERVDFAVRLPGTGDGEPVWLPIDSKFPGDTYAALQEAYDAGDSEQLQARRAALEAEIKRCAKSIRTKYVAPPYTTDFAILFLPFEGLYLEVVNLGLVEVLQREYQVNLAGPSTLAAMLNSLQMGFRTLAIQKKSSEVWKILESAKKEFSTFETVLNAVRNRLRQADEDLEKLIGTRTRAINRELKTVALLEESNKAESKEF